MGAARQHAAPAIAAFVAVIAAITAIPTAAARDGASHRWRVDAVEVRGDPAWRASALEEVIRSELAEPAGTDETRAPLRFDGTIDGDALRVVIADAAGAPLFRGDVALTSTGVEAFRAAIIETTDGLDAALDRETSRAASLEAPGATLSPIALAIAVLIVALFLATPLLVSLRSVRWRQLRSVRLTAGWFVALALVAASALTGHLARLADVAWLVFVVGGVLWGWFVVANARVIFPALHGLSRVEHRDVFRVLRLWAWVAMLRGLRRAAFYAPFLAALWLALMVVAPGTSLQTPIVAAVVLPAWGLAARFWYLSWVDAAAAALDARLVSGAPTDENPWHRAVRGYVVGYIHRSGWEGGTALLENLLFLPGPGRDIALYGGGLTHSRIVIGTELLEFALAPYGRPHDYEAPREHKLFWSGWHAGLMVPDRDGDKPIAPLEVRAAGHQAEPGDVESLHIGQPPTLAGFVEPSALDERRSHRPAEDPTWLEWDPGNDFDGTDPGDHDFLFGALVRELGLAARHDDQHLTLSLALAPRLARAPARLRRVADIAGRPLRRLFERPHIVLGDVYASLNHARHHLIQHLAWTLWREEDALTARAFRPELERQTEEIMRTLAARRDTNGDAERAVRVDRERLAWLSLFSQTPVTTRRERWFRRLGAAAIAAVVIAAVAHNVMRAIQYHPTYVERHGAGEPPTDEPDND